MTQQQSVPEPGDVEIVTYAEEEQHLAAPMVAVVAPSTLQAGYTFTAQVDGKDFVVTVPEGGVTEGQVFEVPYPGASEGTTIASGGTFAGTSAGGGVPPKDNDVVKGMWRKDLLDCCEVFCNGMFWMSWCLNPIIFGQVIKRMKLDAFGYKHDKKEGTCSIITLLFVVFLVLCFVGIGVIVWPIWLIYTLFAFSNARYAYRKHYDIKPSLCDCCDGRMDDFCCIFWCGCCAGIQLARHTHDERQYPYSCCSPTGISDSAPEIV